MPNPDSDPAATELNVKNALDAYPILKYVNDPNLEKKGFAQVLGRMLGEEVTRFTSLEPDDQTKFIDFLDQVS